MRAPPPFTVCIACRGCSRFPRACEHALTFKSDWHLGGKRSWSCQRASAVLWIYVASSTYISHVAALLRAPLFVRLPTVCEHLTDSSDSLRVGALWSGCSANLMLCLVSGPVTSATRQHIRKVNHGGGLNFGAKHVPSDKTGSSPNIKHVHESVWVVF